jgi:hypothetical protein
MYKPVFDSIEEALIQLQYAVADYCSCNDRVEAFSDLDAAIRELRNGANSTHLAIEVLRANASEGFS